MLRYFEILIIIIGLKGCQSVSMGKMWKEEDGVLIIEAERGIFDRDISGWNFETKYPGYQGDGYIVWRGPGDWGPEKKNYDSISNDRHIISYPFTIMNPGVYYVKVLNYHLKEDGDNDVWTSVDKSAWGKTYDWQVNEWTLDERGEWAKYKLNKGEHLVELAGRSKGFAVDQIIIFEEAMRDRFIPKSNSEDTSHREGL